MLLFTLYHINSLRSLFANESKQCVARQHIACKYRVILRLFTGISGNIYPGNLTKVSIGYKPKFCLVTFDTPSVAGFVFQK